MSRTSSLSASAAPNSSTGLDPLSLLSALVLDSGQLWGEAAADWQRADACALLTLDLSTDAPGCTSTLDLEEAARPLTQQPARWSR